MWSRATLNSKGATCTENKVLSDRYIMDWSVLGLW